MVTFDSGVAELQSSRVGFDGNSSGLGVEILRVGTLKDILVFNYVDMNLVVMVVSWVAKHTDQHPRLRRDQHGFWLANMTTSPRCNDNPYILPALASQVRYMC